MRAQEFTQEERRNYIGASDVPALLGMSHFKTPLQLLLQKRGEAEPEVVSSAATWGSHLEPVIAEMITAETGLSLLRTKRDYVHRKMPYFRCHLDRLVKGKPQAVEIKTTTKHVFERLWMETETGIADTVWAQCQSQFACKPDLQNILIAVALLDRREILYKWVQPDPADIEIIETEVEQFWTNCVLGNELPKRMQVEDWKDLSLPTGTSAQATEDVIDLLQHYSEIEGVMSEAKGRLELLKRQLLNATGGVETLTDEQGKPLMTFKRYSTKRFDSSRFKEENAELFESYQKDTESKRLTIVSKNIPSREAFVSTESDETPPPTFVN